MMTERVGGSDWGIEAILFRDIKSDDDIPK
jgi:hypothetical protein